MDKIKVEIHAAEGGADSKLLVKDLCNIYIRFCARKAYAIMNITHADGRSTINVSGVGAFSAFQNETGGHRWQRVPPTEKKGRIQTSTVTVAVFADVAKQAIKLDPRDVEESFMRGSGKGGQHRNKVSTACRLKHIPTGIQIRAESERSQAQNRQAAWDELRKRLQELQDSSASSTQAADRRSQVGSGQRGDKRRTLRERDNIVTDHVSGKKASYESVMAGEIENLW